MLNFNAIIHLPVTKAIRKITGMYLLFNNRPTHKYIRMFQNFAPLSKVIILKLLILCFRKLANKKF
jgi:hypothetical protein